MSDSSKTFTFIKPDGVCRGLVGAIIQRFEQKGLKLEEIVCVVPRRALVEEHYVEHKNEPFFDGLVDSIAEKEVVCAVWSGEGDVVRQVRTLVGPAAIDHRVPGTIRHDFGGTTTRENVIHAADSANAAEREKALWFNEN